jgi:hypothetical protein
MNDKELSPSEKHAYESLSKERIPSPMLVEKTVRSLRKQGILRARWSFMVQFTPLRLAGAIAATIILMIGMFGAGYMIHTSPQPTMFSDAFKNSDLKISTSLQRAGTDYLEALNALASTIKTNNDADTIQGSEVAFNFLYTFADKTVRILPDNPVASNILQAFDTTETLYCADQNAGNKSRIIWF